MMDKERFMKKFGDEEVFCLEYDKSTLVAMVCELQERIDKAIEYNNYFEKSVKEQLDLKQDYSILIASYIGAFHDTLDEILKGDEDEN